MRKVCRLPLNVYRECRVTRSYLQEAYNHRRSQLLSVNFIHIHCSAALDSQYEQMSPTIYEIS